MSRLKLIRKHSICQRHVHNAGNNRNQAFCVLLQQPNWHWIQPTWFCRGPLNELLFILHGSRLKLERSGTVTLLTVSPTGTYGESVNTSWSIFCRIVTIFCTNNSVNLSSSADRESCFGKTVTFFIPMMELLTLKSYLRSVECSLIWAVWKSDLAVTIIFLTVCRCSLKRPLSTVSLLDLQWRSNWRRTFLASSISVFIQGTSGLMVSVFVFNGAYSSRSLDSVLLYWSTNPWSVTHVCFSSSVATRSRANAVLSMDLVFR